MIITEEMIAEDEKRWHAQNIIAELGYCGKHIRHRKSITNDDIRFYAYIMRKAYDLLKAQEEAVPPVKESDETSIKWASWWYVCGACGKEIDYHDRFCRHCGREVKWDD